MSFYSIKLTICSKPIILTIKDFAIYNDMADLELKNFPPHWVIIQYYLMQVDVLQGVDLLQLVPGKNFSMKKLAQIVLSGFIQEGPYNTLEDSRVTMALFKWGCNGIFKAHVSSWMSDVRQFAYSALASTKASSLQDSSKHSVSINEREKYSCQKFLHILSEKISPWHFYKMILWGVSLR